MKITGNMLLELAEMKERQAEAVCQSDSSDVRSRSLWHYFPFFLFFGPKPIIWQLKCKGIVHPKLKNNLSGVSWRERISLNSNAVECHGHHLVRLTKKQQKKSMSTYFLCGVVLMSRRL